MFMVPGDRLIVLVDFGCFERGIRLLRLAE